MRMTRSIELTRPDYDVRLRPLSERDELFIQHWTENASPLLSGYNYGNMTLAERRAWLKSKQRMHRRYFAVDIPERPLIGYIGAKDINPLSRTAMLGIVFDPAFQSQGYGTQALDLFLSYYFDEWGMSALELDVNQFNDRALALYRRAGFEFVRELTERFENQDIDFDDPKLRPFRSCFVQHGGVLYAKIWRMRKEQR
ncbi:MAG: GNAT family N-acetyltransferase [Ndongobacter sp.]|nr:GNAT family N-acetyltransferase [Ndongobacter sp.]